MKQIGRGIGGDKPLISILYAIAFYESTRYAQISSKDKDVIFKAMEHLSVVYKRFLKSIHGWKIGKFYSPRILHVSFERKCHEQFIFSARSRMLDLKCNFKIGQSDLMCRRCLKAEENQKHLLVCPTLADNSILNTGYQPQCEDLYSDNTDKIENIGKILMSKFKLFNVKTMCADNHALLQQPLQIWT